MAALAAVSISITMPRELPPVPLALARLKSLKAISRLNLNWKWQFTVAPNRMWTGCHHSVHMWSKVLKL